MYLDCRRTTLTLGCINQAIYNREHALSDRVNGSALYSASDDNHKINTDMLLLSRDKRKEVGPALKV